MPVPGLTVKAKRFFTTVYSNGTDINGYYNINYDFGGVPDITIVYENTNFKYQIEKPNWLGILTYYAAETTRNNAYSYNYDFNIVGTVTNSTAEYFSTEAWRLASSFRAAYDYYFKYPTKYNIFPPPLPNSLQVSRQGKLVMGIQGSNTVKLGFSHTWSEAWLKGGNHIIFNFWPSNYYTSSGNYTALDIYGTTIHEMTHMKHFDYGMTLAQYTGNHLVATLAESYALAAEYRIVMDEYNIKNTNKYHFNIKYNREYDYKDLQAQYKVYFNIWNVSFKYAYTPFFIDLMDTHDQGSSGSSDINENISEYKLADIDNQLFVYPINFLTIKNNLANQYRSDYKTKINELYNIYSAGK